MNINRLIVTALACIVLQSSSLDSITLTVFPDKIRNAYDEHYKKHEFFLATVTSFKPDQVSLVSRTDRPDVDYNTLATGVSPAALQQQLQCGEIKSYPLHWHKQLHYVDNEDKLVIIIARNDKQFECTSIPHETRKKILNYMKCDQQSLILDGNDFIRSVASFSDDKPYFIKNCNESQIWPGEIIGCYAIVKDIIFIHQYALAIAPGIYLSKTGNGGPLDFCSMQTMLTLWECDHFGKICQQ